MRNDKKVYKIVFLGLMAAIICAVTFLRFPLFGSKVHFANAMCLLAGLLFGGVYGGVTAGVGSVLYDLLFDGRGALDALATFISKGLMAFAAGVIYRGKAPKDSTARSVIASVVGALLYVALYMLKTLIFQHFLYNNTMDATFAIMVSKLPASLLNAVAAMIAAPILNAALHAPLSKIGVFEKTK